MRVLFHKHAVPVPGGINNLRNLERARAACPSYYRVGWIRVRRGERGLAEHPFDSRPLVRSRWAQASSAGLRGHRLLSRAGLGAGTRPRKNEVRSALGSAPLHAQRGLPIPEDLVGRAPAAVRKLLGRPGPRTRGCLGGGAAAALVGRPPHGVLETLGNLEAGRRPRLASRRGFLARPTLALRASARPDHLELRRLRLRWAVCRRGLRRGAAAALAAGPAPPGAVRAPVPAAR